MPIAEKDRGLHTGLLPIDSAWQRKAWDAAQRTIAMAENDPRHLVDRRDLYRQLLLHLPRFHYEHRTLVHILESESRRLHDEIRNDHELFLKDIGHPCRCECNLSETRFAIVSQDLVHCALQRLHYLKSPRSTMVSMGLFCPHSSIPLAIYTLSAFDLQHLESFGPFSAANTLVLSRVFAFPGAPRNHASYGLALLRNYIANAMPQYNFLLTYINPNLGFTGSSMKSANWMNVFREHRDYYLYYKNKYITDRDALNRFKVNKIDALRKIDTNFSRSYARLKDLQIYAIALQKAFSSIVDDFHKVPVRCNIVRIDSADLYNQCC